MQPAGPNVSHSRRDLGLGRFILSGFLFGGLDDNNDAQMADIISQLVPRLVLVCVACAIVVFGESYSSFIIFFGIFKC
jgi:hypothetical protein